MDLKSWVERGTELQCFPSTDDQLLYFNAWNTYDAVYVSDELERILTTVHKLPILNWLGLPDLLQELDCLEDGPSGLPEEWSPGDFGVLVDGAGEFPASWFGQTLEEGALSELLTVRTKLFLPLSAGDKIDRLKRMAGDVRLVSWRRRQTLSTLVNCAVDARLIAAAASSSEIVRMAVPDHASMAALGAEIEERCSLLLGAWWKVFGTSGPRPLTLFALRQAQSLITIEQLLKGIESDHNRNLLTYLRCADMPAQLGV